MESTLPRPSAASAVEALRAVAGRLVEMGTKLNASRLERLQTAAARITLAIDDIDPVAEAALAVEKRQLAEAWSVSAWDASCGAEILSGLVDLMGSESDEPEQLALLRTAFDALNQWITAEVGEIGQAPDATDDTMSVLFDYEAMRSRSVREAVVGDVIPIREGAVRSDGTVRLKIIQPGWGSSGYYSASVLERDGPGIFKAGTKNYWDHPTLTEEVDRPERSLRDLAGELTSDAEWDPEGPEGAGLYANARVRSEFAEPVNEMAPYIGVSIRALGTAHNGQVDGQSGPIIDRLIAGESIDYVTTPGAGGRVMQIFEAHRPKPTTNSPQEVPEDDMEAQKLQEAMADKDREIARLREVALVRDAKEHVAVKLAEVDGLPQVTRVRLSEALSKQAKADKNGRLDVAELDEATEAAVKAEVEYLAKATGGGAIVGFGASSNEVDIEKELAEVLQGQGIGLSESTAKIAARGRR